MSYSHAEVRSDSALQMHMGIKTVVARYENSRRCALLGAEISIGSSYRSYEGTSIWERPKITRARYHISECGRAVISPKGAHILNVAIHIETGLKEVNVAE
jgi:hypothetical protein